MQAMTVGRVLSRMGNTTRCLLRRISGVPTYGLSDNEKTLTLDHIARIALHHPTMVRSEGDLIEPGIGGGFDREAHYERFLESTTFRAPASTRQVG
jgi:hypothetical protein